MTNWPVAPFGRETYSVFESRLPYKNKGVMAEWLMRGTVNTFFRGSIPLDTLNLKTKKVKFIEAEPQAYINKYSYIAVPALFFPPAGRHGLNK